jgi:signal peptidase II
MEKKMKKCNIYIVCLVWLVIDQIIKQLIKFFLTVGEKVVVIPNFFNFYYLQNEGAAFSSLIGMRFLLIMITVVAFFLIAGFIKKNEIESRLERVSLGMILGGMLGNLIDRVSYGYVIDYMSFTFYKYSFAVFNFADMGIVIGVCLLIILMIRGEQNGTK